MKNEVAFKQQALKERLNQEAIIDEQNKMGPGWMQEINCNEKIIEERSKLLNKIQGQENYVQILANRAKNRELRDKDLKDYQKLYSEDLINRLTIKGGQQYEEQMAKIRKISDKRQINASFKDNEQVVQNKTIEQLAKIDQEKADKVIREQNI